MKQDSSEADDNHSRINVVRVSDERLFEPSPASQGIIKPAANGSTRRDFVASSQLKPNRRSGRRVGSTDQQSHDSRHQHESPKTPKRDMMAVKVREPMVISSRDGTPNNPTAAAAAVSVEEVKITFYGDSEEQSFEGNKLELQEVEKDNDIEMNIAAK